MKSSHVQKDLKKLANPVRAKLSQRYFKTGPGQYGEGDMFIGLSVPEARAVAKKYQNIGLAEVAKLISSPIHECRFVALEILVFKYEKGNDADKKKVAAFYLKNRRYVNNWDLVDTSAPYILGQWLADKDNEGRAILYKLAASKSLWDRRIAILATFAFIRDGDFRDTLRLAKLLLNDDHDLMHKAVGWMLREVGKKSESTLKKFLDDNCAVMPRTMLRYAIERFPKNEQKAYLLIR